MCQQWEGKAKIVFVFVLGFFGGFFFFKKALCDMAIYHMFRGDIFF